ncbi:MAG: hypothetical protein KDD37_05700 [Bdellovibrionales bacterium]|nr:hypothetical protein [Bdellovibrionales bacterium]
MKHSFKTIGLFSSMIGSLLLFNNCSEMDSATSFKDTSGIKALSTDGGNDYVAGGGTPTTPVGPGGTPGGPTPTPVPPQNDFGINEPKAGNPMFASDTAPPKPWLWHNNWWTGTGEWKRTAATKTVVPYKMPIVYNQAKRCSRFTFDGVVHDTGSYLITLGHTSLAIAENPYSYPSGTSAHNHYVAWYSSHPGDINPQNIPASCRSRGLMGGIMVTSSPAFKDQNGFCYLQAGRQYYLNISVDDHFTGEISPVAQSSADLAASTYHIRREGGTNFQVDCSDMGSIVNATKVKVLDNNGFYNQIIGDTRTCEQLFPGETCQ